MKKLIFLPICFLLIISCKKVPVADFSFPGITKVGEAIQFTNSSTNSDSYNWDFGDGNTSSEESPSHAYEKPGDYTVTLQAKGEDGTSTASKSIKITGITYSFKNNSNYTLYTFASYYWTGDDIEDWTEHGNLAKGASTDIVITERMEIDCSFYTTEAQTEICVSTDPFPLTVDAHNELIITDNTEIFCIELKSADSDNLSHSENIARKISAIRKFRPVEQE